MYIVLLENWIKYTGTSNMSTKGKGNAKKRNIDDYFEKGTTTKKQKLDDDDEGKFNYSDNCHSFFGFLVLFIINVFLLI